MTITSPVSSSSPYSTLSPSRTQSISRSRRTFSRPVPRATPNAAPSSQLMEPPTVFFCSHRFHVSDHLSPDFVEQLKEYRFLELEVGDAVTLLEWVDEKWAIGMKENVYGLFPLSVFENEESLSNGSATQSTTSTPQKSARSSVCFSVPVTPPSGEEKRKWTLRGTMHRSRQQHLLNRTVVEKVEVLNETETETEKPILLDQVPSPPQRTPPPLPQRTPPPIPPRRHMKPPVPLPNTVKQETPILKTATESVTPSTSPVQTSGTPPATHQGVIRLQNGKRYAVLQPDSLSFYRTQQEYYLCEKPQSRLDPLTLQVKAVEDDVTRLCVWMPSGKQIWKCANKEERDSWVQALQKAVLWRMTKGMEESTPAPERRAMESGKERINDATKAALLQLIRSTPGNQQCAECLSPDPQWASINLGCLVCIECSGAHRSLGVHISKMRSLEWDDCWCRGTVEMMKRMGNDRVNKIYGGKNNQLENKLETMALFVKEKYATKKWVPTRNDNTASKVLYEAIVQQDMETAMLALAQGASLHYHHTDPASHQATPLHAAVLAVLEQGFSASGFVVWCLQNGANVALTDRLGQRALDLAEKEENSACSSEAKEWLIQYLKSWHDKGTTVKENVSSNTNSSNANTSNSIVFSGHVMKLGGKSGPNRLWQKRFLVLDQQGFRYYAKQQQNYSGVAPLGQVSPLQYQSTAVFSAASLPSQHVAPAHYLFGLEVHCQDRTFQFLWDRESDRVYWERAFDWLKQQQHWSSYFQQSFDHHKNTTFGRLKWLGQDYWFYLKYPSLYYFDNDVSKNYLGCCLASVPQITSIALNDKMLVLTHGEGRIELEALSQGDAERWKEALLTCKCFRVPLRILATRATLNKPFVPELVQQCIEFIQKTLTHLEGNANNVGQSLKTLLYEPRELTEQDLFLLDSMKLEFDTNSNGSVDLQQFCIQAQQFIFLVAVLIKEFMAELPETLINEAVLERVWNEMQEDEANSETSMEQLNGLLSLLPLGHASTLQALVQHFLHISSNDDSILSVLCEQWAPILIPAVDENQGDESQVLWWLIKALAKQKDLDSDPIQAAMMKMKRAFYEHAHSTEQKVSLPIEIIAQPASNGNALSTVLSVTGKTTCLQACQDLVTQLSHPHHAHCHALSSVDLTKFALFESTPLLERSLFMQERVLTVTAAWQLGVSHSLVFQPSWQSDTTAPFTSDIDAASIQGWLHCQDGKKPFKRFYFVYQSDTKSLHAYKDSMTKQAEFSLTIDARLVFGMKRPSTLGFPTTFAFCLVHSVTQWDPKMIFCAETYESRTEWLLSLMGR